VKAPQYRQHFVVFHVVFQVPFKVSVLAAFHWTAGVLPFLKSSKERPGVADPEFSQRERRTGARFLGRSTAVRDDGFSKTPYPFEIGLHRLERNRHSAWNVAGCEAVLTSNVHDRHGAL
jgi:hypothetical protein